jgi:hypothetical protein
MKKSLILGVALSIAALTGFGWAGVTQAQERHGNGDHGWHNDDSNRGYGVSARDFIGNWRLDERHNHGRNGGLASSFNQLPQMIRIERDRRDLRVENSRGRLLREIDLRGGDARDGRLQLVTTGSVAHGSSRPTRSVSVDTSWWCRPRLKIGVARGSSRTSTAAHSTHA